MMSDDEIWNTCFNRSKWDKGEWDNESDFVQWIDPKTQLLCLMNRNSFGAWCGYVGIPKGHRHYNEHYDSVEANCHGGLTYSGERKSVDNWEDLDITESTIGFSYCNYGKKEYKDLWWVGFDCAHYMDGYPFNPIAMYKKLTGGSTLPTSNTGEIYRNEAYVRGECTKLAKQLFKPTELQKVVIKIRNEIKGRKAKKASKK